MLADQSQRLSGAKLLAIAIFVFCGAWLVMVGMLRLTTAKPVPIVNIRWAKQATIQQRDDVAHALSLVLNEPKERDTGAYFVLDPRPQNLKRIVAHPLIEDTAYIDRNAFILAHPPTAQMWLGDRYPALKIPAVLYACLTGLILSGVALEIRYVSRKRLAS